MAVLNPAKLLLCLLLLAYLSSVHGLIGYGIRMYYPSCAFACRASIESFPLACSSKGSEHSGHMKRMDMGMAPSTAPECRASDTPFLQTLAWCMNEQCTPLSIKPWELEKYWGDEAVGDPTVVPKWTYSEAFHNITEMPMKMVEEHGQLNFTAAVDAETWESQKLTLEYFEAGEATHSKYGLIILVLGFTVPIACSALGYIPHTASLLDRINRFITYPSTIGTHNITPLSFSLGYAPTVAQSLYIAFVIILNVVLVSVGYRSTQPNAWFASRYAEILAYVSSRTGVLAFAITPLLMLFSGRNNFLLYVTNWSHSTYLLLHRWVAWVFAAQVIAHSIGELIIYYPEHKTESAKLYWIWGVVGTLAVVVILFISVLYVRRASYELFLIGHILMAVFVLVGSWYHVEYLFTRKWGYQYWLYAAFGVWMFDRLFRVLRMLQTGVQRSNVTEVTKEIVRIDIPGVRWSLEPGKHAYVSFPTLSLRPWENHPFSVVPTALLHRSNSTTVEQTSGTDSPLSEDVEKTAKLSTREVYSIDVALSPINVGGVTLFVRKAKGMTKRLNARSNLPTLLEGPYKASQSTSIFKTDRLVIISGGIGITGAFPYLSSHINSKLYWSCKEANSALVREFEGALTRVGKKDILVGGRFNVYDVMEREAALGGKLGVIVCGPAGMCDDVRQAVVNIGKERKAVIDLHVEAFSW